MQERMINSLKNAVVELNKKTQTCDEKQKTYLVAISEYIEIYCEKNSEYNEDSLYSIKYIFKKEIENALSSLLNYGSFWHLFKIFGTIAWEKRLESGPPVYTNGKNILDLYSVSNSDLPQEVLIYIDFIRIPIIEFRLNMQNEKYLSRAEFVRKEIQNKIDNISSIYNSWNTELLRLEDISRNLRYKMNFVGLSAAYQDLISSKRKEMSHYFISMSVFFLSMVLTPVIAPSLMEMVGYPVYDHINPASGVVLWSNLTSKLTISAPFFLLFLYMFRICLRNFQSVRGQIVQLQIRQAVCQFVEAYSEYVGKKSSVIKDNGEHLKKFESLIFSGLTPDPDSIPSTFDGFEQLIEAAKAIRGNGRT